MKLLLGEPFTHEEISQWIEQGKIPPFWEEKPEKTAIGPKTRAQGEVHANDRSDDGWRDLPFVGEKEKDESDESDVEREDPPPRAAAARKTVRFAE